MKKYISFLMFVALAMVSSCSDDFLTIDPTESQASGGSATEGAIDANVTSAYQILLFDTYADNQYNSIVFMSDLRSDDIYKGGNDAGDQQLLYHMSQFNMNPSETPEGLWNIYYTGIARCNDALTSCDNAVDVSEDRVAELRSQALFLRAYYTHWLWKFWGNIPYFTAALESPYMAPQYTADEIYDFIMADLDEIIDLDALPMRYDTGDEGRATMAAVYMLKARVVMYQKDDSRYTEVMSEMNKVVNGGYELVDFASIWPREGEFCDESILEVNHLPGEYGGKTWASGWSGYGTNLPAFISPNELKNSEVYQGGWGFGPVRTEVFDLYEEGDVRREASINHFESDDYTVRFQNTGYFMAKYAARIGYNLPPGDQDLNYENNLRIFRLSEAYLNIAELITIDGVAVDGGLTAQEALDAVRTRAKVGAIAPTAANIKLERRREFLGEGMRFWDLVRWGDTALLNEDNAAFSSTRTWSDYMKYLPIPVAEIDKTEGEYKLVQNPGYN
ncbi:RagB/SusD family nutrient uptake outer membrane protein [Geofilum sp. OHC36d9]|uniref:RagB/SusD family nutrient uptake outer membrane protein n=1 Tax=Geofilum sp. OHC36d9 TaxID=3458413 RepID=UPI004033DA33